MRKILNALAVVFIVPLAYGDPPTETSWCGPGACTDLAPELLFLDCPGYPSSIAYSTRGRHLIGPLRCVGPIKVSMQLPELGGDVETLPLFVEIRQDPSTTNCNASVAGSLVWQAPGGGFSCDRDSLWVTSPLIDLPRFVDIGNQYFVQIEGFRTWDANNLPLAASPYIICGRIRVVPTPVVASTWGRVKVLYREANK